MKMIVTSHIVENPECLPYVLLLVLVPHLEHCHHSLHCQHHHPLHHHRHYSRNHHHFLHLDPHHLKELWKIDGARPILVHHINQVLKT